MRKIYCDATDEEIDSAFIQTHAITVQDPWNDRHKFLNVEGQMRFKDLPTFIDYLYEQYDRAPWIPNGKKLPPDHDGVVIKLA